MYWKRTLSHSDVVSADEMFEQGFTAMESGSCGKVVLDWNL